MKNKWPVKNLGEAVDLKNGRSFKTSEWGSVGLPIIRIQNLNDKAASFNYFNGAYNEDILIKHGDLLFSWSGSLGTSFGAYIWNGDDGLLNQHIFKVLLKDETLNKNFLFLYLNKIVREIESRAHGGAGLVHVTKYELERFQIPTPTQSIQEKIVERLDAIRKSQELIELQIQKTEEFFESILFHNLKKDKSWKVLSIKEFSKLLTGGTPSKNKSEYWKNGIIPWLVSGDIHKEFINDCEGRITESGLENSNAKILPINSVLIALNGQGKTRGTVAYLQFKATCNQSLAAISVDKDIVNSKYLFYFLKSKYSFIRSITGDLERSGLNLKIIGDLAVDVPPFKKQKEIVERFDAVQEYKKLLQRQKELYKELFNSVLYKSMRGEMD